jgi:hypothetical protein
LRRKNIRRPPEFSDALYRRMRLFPIAYAAGEVKGRHSPKSTTLFRNPAAGADITAFTTSHSVKDIICPAHHNIVFLHRKQ